jgi:CPA2 family monovalent cation:H+ antiporter-2
MDNLAQVILLLAVAVAIMVAFQRLHVPTSLGYLLVGLILGPHTAGPTVNVAGFKVLAEFGVVFLLFSIGLNYPRSGSYPVAGSPCAGFGGPMTGAIRSLM